MLRECDLAEISDGKKYTETDMVKADCNDCRGCSQCCEEMGTSIVLDPLDLYRISSYQHKRFEELLESVIELNIVDGVILPNLKMTKNPENQKVCCQFLNKEGRCSIHPYRPGICRIFPLGRLYEDGDFSYILQVHECPKENKAKVKVAKWIDTPDMKQNHAFIKEWHYFLVSIHDMLIEKQDEELIKKVSMEILQFFYIEPFHEDTDFYEQFYERLSHIKKKYGIG